MQEIAKLARAIKDYFVEGRTEAEIKRIEDQESE